MAEREGPDELSLPAILRSSGGRIGPDSAPHDPPAHAQPRDIQLAPIPAHSASATPSRFQVEFVQEQQVLAVSSTESGVRFHSVNILSKAERNERVQDFASDTPGDRHRHGDRMPAAG